MKTTIELLDMLRVQTGLSDRALGVTLGQSEWAIAKCRMRGRLTPILAGKAAQMQGLNVAEYMALAILENQKASPSKRSLLTQVNARKRRKSDADTESAYAH